MALSDLLNSGTIFKTSTTDRSFCLCAYRAFAPASWWRVSSWVSATEVWPLRISGICSCVFVAPFHLRASGGAFRVMSPYLRCLPPAWRPLSPLTGTLGSGFRTRFYIYMLLGWIVVGVCIRMSLSFALVPAGRSFFFPETGTLF